MKRHFELELQRYLDLRLWVETPFEPETGLDLETQQQIDSRRCFEVPTEPESEHDPGTQHCCLLGSRG